MKSNRKSTAKHKLSMARDKIASLEGVLSDNDVALKMATENMKKASSKIEFLNQQLYVSNRRLQGLNECNTELNECLKTSNGDTSVHNTLSFKLGYTLIHSTKSLGAFVRLPSDLWGIYIEAKNRRNKRSLTQTNTSDNPSDLKLKVMDVTYKRAEHYDLSHLKELAEKIPVSNGTRYFKKHNFSVGIITDEFMFNYYNNAFADLTYLTPDNYRESFNAKNIDLLIYISCWSGITGDEWRGVKYREKPRRALTEILKLCKDRNIPTAFQTIEDPSNYEHFLGIAKEFDHIFTTDIEKIEDYKNDCDNPNVFFGEFGVNPLFNNPIGIGQVAFNAAFFAGSYPARYKERCNDMETIFGSLIDSDAPLVIANRNSDRTEEIFQFPDVYGDYIIPKIEHSFLQRIHKLFKYNINFNSIKHSPTMCAMRIYELQGQGALIISNYAKSVNNTFPNIDIVNCPSNMGYHFESLQTLEDYEDRITAVRNVMTDKTVFDQTAEMLKNIGLGEKEYPLPKVLILCDKITANISSCVNDQTYPNIELSTTGEAGAIYHNSNFVTFFDNNNTYKSNYVNDLINAFKYTDSDYVTKSSYFEGETLVDGPQHEYVNLMTSKFRTIFDSKKFRLEHLLSLDSGEAIKSGYSIDPFELNCGEIPKKAKLIPQDYVLSVIVPVYNNGEFLIHKCIRSLRRNRAFHSIEIILVDDGSSKKETLKTIDILKQRYSNVVAFKFETGGSGSASRPRNKGIELASAPLVSFLDPDNEISPGGYDELLDIYSRNSANGTHVDFVSGYQVKVCKNQTVTGKHSAETDVVIENPKNHFLNKGNFPVVSTQAAVIESRLLREAQLDFVTGAIGQDTLYGHELLCVSKRAAFTSKAHILYYAEREDSVTNLIDLEFFKKCKVLEEAQVQRFKKWEILETYKDSKFDYFFKHWYLKKFNYVDPSKAEDCKKILVEILSLYGVDPEIYF